jgi:hypothetical protein
MRQMSGGETALDNRNGMRFRSTQGAAIVRWPRKGYYYILSLRGSLVLSLQKLVADLG